MRKSGSLVRSMKNRKKSNATIYCCELMKKGGKYIPRRQHQKKFTYIDSFEALCKKNLTSYNIADNFFFKCRLQQEVVDLQLEQIVMQLRLLIKDCNYPAELQDEMICDHIVFGTRYNKKGKTYKCRIRTVTAEMY